MYKKKVHIHFVGIGGIGMSGIAIILRQQKYTISGCDKDLNQPSIEQLKKIGCAIYQGNNTPSCHDSSIDIVVYSSAIAEQNPEIIAARERKIPTISRALMLAELMRTKYSIAIAGSHGKTTTTSLISHIMLEAHMDPTIVIGGHLKALSTNARMGEGDFLVAEADESDRSFLHLQATLAVVTNIDLEHLETYKNIADIIDTFKQFLNNLPFYGKAILCLDDENVRSLLPLPHIKTITYGTNPAADISATDIMLYPEKSSFIAHAGSTVLGPVTVNMPGIHNVRNALAALALTRDLGVAQDVIAGALATFKGIDRRFSYCGTFKGAQVFDDYGHHPNEIIQTLKVAQNRENKRSIVIFQPHRYTRTQHLWDLFIEAFATSGIDQLIITDIYAASEAPIEGITAQALTKALQDAAPHLNVSYAPYQPDFHTIKEQLDILIEKDDLLLLLGAGKINTLAPLIVEKIES